MLHLIAKILARPAVADWLIRRAMRTPYFHLVDADGSTYMERYWLFNPYPPRSDAGKRRWGDRLPSVRLHKIMRHDLERNMHDHPWDARTFILRGWYWEVREHLDDPYPFIAPHPDGVAIRRDAGTTASLRHGDYHRITYVSPGGVWTLFITWRHRGTWGFLVNGRKVPWREYLKVEDEKA